jgi:hypothetical protein
MKSPTFDPGLSLWNDLEISYFLTALSSHTVERAFRCDKFFSLVCTGKNLTIFPCKGA